MSYVWINPVVASMYDAYVLDEFLQRFGHTRVEVEKDWGTIVREKYLREVSKGKKPVADMRCPKIREILTETNVTNEVTAPDIPPILIHCGIEISERQEWKDEEKIITTPCQALADMGNSLGLENTWFVTWNQFLGSLTGSLTGMGTGNGEFLKSSPIPPGFFNDQKINTVSLTGKEEIREYFTKDIPADVQMIELLYCKEGCHNGDGIREKNS